jgi:ABC-type branched-subunit amino acid transport system ATPase component
MLDFEDVSAGYSNRLILRSVSLRIDAGTIFGLIGHNGSGKSTLLRTIAGVLRSTAGRISFDGHDVERRSLQERQHLGIALVPQGNRVFAQLTGRENLQVCVRERGQLNSALDETCAQFPALTSCLARRAGLLSGGQKQMLSIAMALVRKPRLLLLDEPALGLASGAIGETFKLLQRLRASGLTLVVAEQNVTQLLGVADRVCALRNGQIAFLDKPALLAEPSVLQAVFM